MTDMPTMRAAFRTTVSGNGKYEMVFRFPTMEAMHKADDEWRASTDAAPVVGSGQGVISDAALAAILADESPAVDDAAFRTVWLQLEARGYLWSESNVEKAHLGWQLARALNAHPSVPDAAGVSAIVTVGNILNAKSVGDLYGWCERLRNRILALAQLPAAEPVPSNSAIDVAWEAFQNTPIDLCADSDDEQRKCVEAAIQAYLAASRPGAEPVASHEVDADGKPTDDSDPWFQLGWHKERLTEAESELATWKERAMSLRLSNGAAEPVGMREALDALEARVETGR